ncbi:MAG: hypothetical protein WKF92_04215 [Pyrinomonadaceae bacterium]
MEQHIEEKIQKRCRKDERGAVLIMVLMISFLLMVAVSALLIEASMNTANVTDATAEEQAYYAAESGIQSVVSVLRGNTENGIKPGPLLDGNKPITDKKNRIDYFKAVKTVSSNIPNDLDASGNAYPARLSRWMTYNFPAANPDRIVLGDPAAYTEKNGMAYSVNVSDPDNVGDTVTYSTSGFIESSINGTTKSWTDGSGRAVSITYVPKGSTTLDVSTGESPADFGRFEMRVGPLGGDVTMLPARVRFIINVNVSQPYNTTKTIRGHIDPGTVTTGSAGNVRLFFDSKVYVAQSSEITLTPPSGVDCASDGTGSAGCGRTIENIFLAAPEGYYRSGYNVIPYPGSFASPGVTTITGTMSAPQPIRLLIRSIGFGPHGARKELESIIQKDYFNGLEAPSPLTLIGARCTNLSGTAPCNPHQTTSNFLFDPGSSAPIVYSGKDALLKAFLPPVGVTNDINLGLVNSAVAGMNGSVFGVSANVSDELPFWLQSPANLNAALQQLKGVADASGDYYAPGVTPPNNNNNSDYGNYTAGTGITYVDGDLTLGGDGGGILVVMGKLRFHGEFNWKGLVIVTGPAGFERSGAGGGNLQGSMVVAPFDANSLARTPNNLSCFLSPRYEISGGGNSTLQYNSNNVTNGLNSLSNFVKGVAEK